MLIIFDMDGTLVDSSNTLTNAINYVRAKLGLEPLKKSVVIEQINNPNCNLPKFFYEVDKIEPIHEQWFKEYYSANHDKELVLFDGVKEMLDALKKKDIKLAIATNAYRNSTLEALKHLKIEQYFDDLICYDDVDEGKPSPKMLNLLMQRNGADSKNTLFIGDSDRDELAAIAANIAFIRVAFGQESKNAVSNPKEIIKIVDKLLYNNKNLKED